MRQKTMLMVMRSAARGVQLATIMIATLSSVHAQTPSGAPIRLGLIAELSGPLAFYGAETNRAATVMVKEINASGGLLGRPVELISRDSKGTVTEAVRQARDLLLTENVDFLLHSISSAECIGVSSVAKQAQKILISNCANDDFTGKDGNNYAFRIVNITTRTQGYAGAEYIHKNLMARVRKCSEAAGYSSPQEFVQHIIERELAKIEDAGSDEDIVKRMKGLGYLD